jgi:hypothetical protein
MHRNLLHNHAGQQREATVKMAIQRIAAAESPI